MSIDTLPNSSLTVANHYFHIKAAENKFVRCPYFRNARSGRDRWGLAVYGGKGSPQEIEEELKIVEKLEGADFSKMEEFQIRDIMKKRKLGVECSGFIAHVLDGWAREFYKKPIYKLLNFNRRGIGWLLCRMRPYTHIDVETLVSYGNAREVMDARQIGAGDLIRFNSEIDHAIIVTATERDEGEILHRVQYAQSVFEENREGVKKGIIEFTKQGSPNLLDQTWKEEPDTGHTIKEKGEPRVYRLYIVESVIHNS